AELLGALGHVPPHAAGAGEVLAGAGVVDAAGAGAGDAALEAVQRLGDVEVGAGEVADRGVGELLHPGLQRIGAVEETGRVRVQGLLRRGDGGAAAGAVALVQARRDLLLLGDDAAQLLDAPGVGLVEVDLGAEEGSRGELGGLTTPRLRLRWPR